MMGIVTGLLATTALSHLGGQLAGGVLARLGLWGFGRKLRITRKVLKVGQALHTLATHNPTPEARNALQAWLQQHDPHNETGLGTGLVE